MNKKSLSKKVDILKHINNLPKKEKFVFVRNCDEDCIHTICEALYNLLNNTFDLNKKQKANLIYKLKPIRGQIRQLSDHNTSIKTKKRLLSNPQVGQGVFNFLASTALPALLALL